MLQYVFQIMISDMDKQILKRKDKMTLLLHRRLYHSQQLHTTDIKEKADVFHSVERLTQDLICISRTLYLNVSFPLDSKDLNAFSCSCICTYMENKHCIKIYF